jgi:hypothetical protein
MDIRIITSMSYKGRGWEMRRSRKHSQESRSKKRDVRRVEMKMLRWTDTGIITRISNKGGD